MISRHRSIVGSGLAILGIAVLSAVMVPARSTLSVATAALVLVIPVVIGVIVGGFIAGVVGVVLGFLTYDFLFIRPFDTLSVGGGQNWLALAVYAVVMLAVAQVVAVLQRARAEAHRREAETRRLYELSEELIGDKPQSELLELVASTVQTAFGARWVAVLLPGDGDLSVATTTGEPLSDEEMKQLSPAPGRLEQLGTGGGRSVGIVRVVLIAAGRPVGLLATSGTDLDQYDSELLHTYANHAALALERGQLRSQAVRSQLLEEVDRWRGAMMGAVSHDLRTPLASVKAAVSTLRRSDVSLTLEERLELLELIETQSDRLDRLVTSLLDMTRLESGALELHREVQPVSDLVDDAVAALNLGAPRVGASAEGHRGRVDVDVPDDLPPVDVDQLLMRQVLTNLLDNALRFSPEGTAVEVTARLVDDRIELSVRDHGPGIPPADRERAFGMFNRIAGGGRAGLGLTIARAFVEAHGESISIHEAAGGGARLVVTLPLAPVDDRE
ncbi:MAG TPA: ATP-binding protein [Acidimicrobiales bacterium]|jgi:two-component system sensor histidine kinase KdpD